MSRGFKLQWTPRHGSTRKLVFEPQLDGEYPWARIEFERRDARWRQVGVEYLTEVAVTPVPPRAHRDGGDGDA